MMDSFGDSDEEKFFDMHEEIDYVSDCDSDHSVDSPANSGVSGCVSDDFSYEFWALTPESVNERRSRFLEQMGLSVKENPISKEEPSGNISSEETKIDVDRERLDLGGVVTRNSSSDFSLFTRSSSMSYSSTEEDDLSTDCDFENSLINKVRDLNIGAEFNTSKIGILSKLREAGSNKLVKMDKFQKSGKNNVNTWLKQLKRKVHTKDANGESSLKVGARLRRTRVRSHKKKLKELSSLYEGQDFCAHEGLLLAMKFSPDGRFLASGGEDGVVRVWQVIEEEGESKLDNQSIDPSCLYFSVNHNSKLVPVDFGKEKNWNEKSKKPGCVVFPQKAFRLAEEPLHEFRGHCGEVLALSWSSKECLLSSSVDKTVRLWQMGHDECIQVFCHSNYVTCVEFNPLDDNYFISGSIDGKIRIWKVNGCQVVDWIDIKEMVTAVCYYPSGKRAIVGSMDGSCRFYDIKENLLQLDTQIFLPGKKKLLCKRITGFQFSPSDSSQVLVTSADSQVRVLSGSDVIFKIKGSRMSGSQVTASFTEDGKHIVSGSEDSNIHMWDYNITNSSPSKPKSTGSRESFVSYKSSIALPWCGIKTNSTPSLSLGNDTLGSILETIPCDSDTNIRSSSPDCFSPNHGMFTTKGAATWPEEKLDDMYIPTSPSKFEFQVLKSACESYRMWGLVIVTGGRDGRIRTYHNYGLPIHL